MATQLTRTQIEAIGIHDSRINEDTLQPDGTLSASYTQAGAYPGQPKDQQATAMALEASGSQTDGGHLRVRTSRAGSPGIDEGAFLWRDVAAGDAASEYQGWDGYQAVTGVEGLYRNPGTGAGGSDVAVIRLGSGNVLAGYAQADGTGDLVADLYKPSAQAWTTRTPVSISGAAASVLSVALVEMLPEARVLAYVPNSDDRNIIAVYSDDEGATWDDAARNVLRTDLPAGVTINEIRAAYSGDQVVMFVQYTDGGTEELAQYASTDRGVRFDLVSETWDITGEDPDTCSVTALRGGGFLLCYSDPSGTPLYISRRIGSAFEDAQTAAAVTVAATPTAGEPTVSVWEDEDGTVYALAAVIDGAASWSLRLLRSSNRGDSWDVWGGPVAELNPGAVDTELNEFACTSTGGLGILITRYTAPNDGESGSAVVVVYLGGHGSHTLPATDEAVGTEPLTNFPDTAFIPWSQSDDNGKAGGLYLSIEEPQNVGWTGGGGGSESITSAQELEIVGTAQVRSFRRQVTDATLTACVCEFDVEVDAGDGDDTTTQIAVEAWLSDYDGTPASATYTYGITIRIDAAGWSLYDENAAIVGAAVTQDMTDFIKVRFAISSNGFVKSWYAAHGPQKTEWTAGPGGALTNTTADQPNEIQFGHITSGTNTSRWKHVGYNFWGWKWAVQSATTIGASWTNPDDLHGRAYSSRPVLLHDGVRFAAKDGPSFIDEQWTIKPEHTYALTNILPGSAPSPRRGWRNTAHNVLEYVVFDLDDDFGSTKLLNHSLVFWFQECNLESIEIETYDGAAWQALATATSTDDWDSLEYDRRGRTVIVKSGAVTTGERYFQYFAHAGDTFDLGTESDNLHLIERNSEGAWIGATETKKPTIMLKTDNMPGALADQNFGTGKVRRKDFGVIVHSYNDDHAAIRLKIPAQKTAQGDYRIGQVFMGHLAAFARPHDLGWSQIREMDVETFRHSGGTRSARNRGPSRRVVEIAWADGWSDATQVRTSEPDPDFIRGQTSAALAIGTPRDTVELVEGVHIEQDGPLAPVLYLGKVPTDTSASHPLSEPRDVVYGRLETSPRFDNTLGRRGTDDANRLNTITIREEV